METLRSRSSGGSVNYGVYVTGAGSSIRSATGNVSVTGTGSTGVSGGFNGSNYGVLVSGGGLITAGGNGKTPMVIWLVEHLQQRGYRVGVVSRGYGGKSAVYPLVLGQNTSTREAGDEPVLIYQRTGAPVAIAPKRAEAVQALARVDKKELAIVDRAAREANAIIDQRTFSWTTLFAHFEATLPEDVRITAITPRPASKMVRIGVEARTVDDLDQFIEGLEMSGAFRDLGLGIVFAAVLVYLLMVVNFQSWTDPFIILTALGGAAVGIVLALFATGTTFSVPSLMGAIMASAADGVGSPEAFMDGFQSALLVAAAIAAFAVTTLTPVAAQDRKSIRWATSNTGSYGYKVAASMTKARSFCSQVPSAAFAMGSPSACGRACDSRAWIDAKAVARGPEACFGGWFARSCPSCTESCSSCSTPVSPAPGR